jgi:hypothetical protein
MLIFTRRTRKKNINPRNSHNNQKYLVFTLVDSNQLISPIIAIVCSLFYLKLSTYAIIENIEREPPQFLSKLPTSAITKDN